MKTFNLFCITMLMVVPAVAQENVYRFDKMFEGSTCIGTPSCPNTTFRCNNQTNSDLNLNLSVDKLNVVTKMDLIIRGKFQCGGKGPISIFLNGHLFAVKDPVDSHCSCEICDTVITYNSSATSGLSLYNHQGPNTLSISSKHTICVSRITAFVHAVNMITISQGVALPLCGPMSGGTHLQIYTNYYPIRTGNIYFRCLFTDSVNKRNYTSEVTPMTDGLACDTPAVAQAGDMVFGVYVPSVNYIIPFGVSAGSDPVKWTFYKVPILQKIVKGVCNETKVEIIGQNFVNGSCGSQVCKWEWANHKVDAVGNWKGSDTFECEKPLHAPTGSAVSVSLDSKVYTKSIQFICDGGFSAMTSREKLQMRRINNH